MPRKVNNKIGGWYVRPRTLSRRLFVVVAIALMPALVIGVSTILIVQRQSADALHAEAYRAAELACLELEHFRA
jgi:hypothetical protein